MDKSSLDVFYIQETDNELLSFPSCLEYIDSAIPNLSNTFSYIVNSERYNARQEFLRTPDPLLNDEQAEIRCKQRIESVGRFEDNGLASAIRFEINLQTLMDIVNNLKSLSLVDNKLVAAGYNNSDDAYEPDLFDSLTSVNLEHLSSYDEPLALTTLETVDEYLYLMKPSLPDNTIVECLQNFYNYQHLIVNFVPTEYRTFFFNFRLDMLNDQQFRYLANDFREYWFFQLVEKCFDIFNPVTLENLIDLTTSNINGVSSPSVLLKYFQFKCLTIMKKLKELENLPNVRNSHNLIFDKVPISKTDRRKRCLFRNIKLDINKLITFLNHKNFSTIFSVKPIFDYIQDISFINFKYSFKDFSKFKKHLINKFHYLYLQKFSRSCVFIKQTGIDKVSKFKSYLCRQLNQLRKKHGIRKLHYDVSYLSKGRNLFEIYIFVSANITYGNNLKRSKLEGELYSYLSDTKFNLFSF